LRRGDLNSTYYFNSSRHPFDYSYETMTIKS